MKKNLPRYQNNIFVSNKKHLLRSINKYIEYESVKKIYLFLCEENNKFQLILNESNIGVLIYDRFEALKRNSSTKEILNVLNSRDLQDIQQFEVLKEVQNIVRYYNVKNDFNKIFMVDKNEVIKKFKKIIFVKKDKYIQYPSLKDVDITSMVATRLYYTILNKLNLNIKLFRILNEQVKNQIDSFERLKVELETLTLKKENFNWGQFDFYETNISYEDLITAIELFDNNEYSISSIAPGYNLQMLVDEKYMYEHNIEAYILEYNLQVELKTLFYDEVKIHFNEYIKIYNYLNFNKKNFTKNSIGRYINYFNKRIKSHERLSGSARRLSYKDLEIEFGIDFKDFYKKLKSFSSSEKNDFINKIFILKQYNNILTKFTQNDLKKIFDNLPLELNKKEVPTFYYTSYEKRQHNQYDEMDKEFDLLSEKIFYFESQKNKDPENFDFYQNEIEKIKERTTYLLEKMDEIDSYENSLHPNTVKFMERNNSPLEFEDNFDEKSYDEYMESEYKKLQEEENLKKEQIEILFKQDKHLEIFKMDQKLYFQYYDSILIKEVVKVLNLDFVNDVLMDDEFKSYEEYENWFDEVYGIPF